MPGVRTRFAPSPTGYMHIGGMRTALFNWLFARRHGGSFVLRIDDTDRQRNVEAALAPILDAFRWLELDWDEGPEVGGEYGPYFQSERDDLYRVAVEGLLESGLAYRCFETPDEIQAARAEAKAEGRTFVGTRASLELDPDTVAAYLADERPCVVRFQVPRDQRVVIEDAVRGRVEWDAGLIPDPVIQRGDGSPLYNFATVVDDAAMQISHVIRAEEHLSNTPVQVLLHQALGHDLPVFAHLPYVAAPGTQEKLSKRKLDKYRNNPQFRRLFEAAERVLPRIGRGGDDGPDPVMVEYYEVMGYRPEALFNGLSRLGWSLDDKTDVVSTQTVIDNFTLDRVTKSSAIFDQDKLLWMNGMYIRELTPEQLAGRMTPFLERDLPKDLLPVDADYLRQIAPLLQERIKRLDESADITSYFFKADEQFDTSTFVQKGMDRDSTLSALKAALDDLSGADDFQHDTGDEQAGDPDRPPVFFREERIPRVCHGTRIMP